MARVVAYPTGAPAKALAKIGALISRKTAALDNTRSLVTWQPTPVTWQPNNPQWYAAPFANWQDCPDKWSDCTTYWNAHPPAPTQAFIRAQRTLYGNPTGAYAVAAQAMQQASIRWRQITATARNAWNTSARQRNTDARKPVIDPRTGAPRFATRRQWTGFSLFVATYADNAQRTLATPEDPTNTEESTMTELITGTDYEQRILATLAATDGNITIAMYQVSPNWSGPSLAASPLFDALLAQPTRRAACRLILGTPTGGTSLNTLNEQAAQIMTAAGWSVRRVGAFPVLHAKLWLIERGFVYAGSHNLSNRATTSNREAGILTTANGAVVRARNLTTELWNAAA